MRPLWLAGLTTFAHTDESDRGEAFAPLDGMARENDDEVAWLDGLADEGGMHGRLKTVIARLNRGCGRDGLHPPYQRELSEHVLVGGNGDNGWPWSMTCHHARGASGERGGDDRLGLRVAGKVA